MKPETLIYEKVRDIIPEKSEKTVFFAEVSETSYEVFFYSYIDGKAVQCYEFTEQDKLDENDLDEVFEAIAGIIRKSKVFISGKYNIATIKIDRCGVKMYMDYMDKDVRMYKIKKEWEKNNLQ